MKTIRQKATKYWWVIASLKDPKHGWNWQWFFRSPTNTKQNLNWGGPNWIRSTISFKRIRQMREGDIVVAYQAGEGVVGLARLARSGYRSQLDGEFDTFDLCSRPTVWLRNPIPFSIIKVLPQAEGEIEFVKILRGTVFAIEGNGFARLIHLVRAFNPGLNRKIDQFLS